MNQLSGGNNKYAFRDSFGPGVMVTKVGAIAYVHQCKAIKVQRRDFQNCSEEIPVQIVDSGEMVFMDPFTQIIQTMGTVVPCTEVMDRKFKLGSEWFCQYPPKLKKCKGPEQLNATLEGGTFHFDFSSMGKDIYSPEEHESHRKYMVRNAQLIITFRSHNLSSRGQKFQLLMFIE